MCKGAFFCNAVHKYFGIDAGFFKLFNKHIVAHKQLVAVHNVFGECKRKHRLTPAGGICDYGYCSGWSNGSNRCIAHGKTGFAENRLFPRREDAAFRGKLRRGSAAFALDKAHNFFGSLFCFNGVVWYAKLKKHIGKTHYSKTYFTGAASVFVNLLQRIMVYVNYVIKEVNRIMNNARKLFIINGGNSVNICYAKAKVD